MGLAETSMTPELTAEEVERMRTIVAQADQKNRAETKEFDLNKPPQKPYTHQEFPRIVYHHSRRVHKAVANEAELAEALKDGWKKEPYPNEAPEAAALEPEKAKKTAGK